MILRFYGVSYNNKFIIYTFSDIWILYLLEQMVWMDIPNRMHAYTYINTDYITIQPHTSTMTTMLTMLTLSTWKFTTLCTKITVLKEKQKIQRYWAYMLPSPSEYMPSHSRRKMYFNSTKMTVTTSIRSHHLRHACCFTLTTNTRVTASEPRTWKNTQVENMWWTENFVVVVLMNTIE